MKISDLLKKDTLSLSFEVFPPKSDATFESIEKSALAIAALNPSFMSITYGAGGGTSKYTLDLAKKIKEKYNVSTLAHLTCISSTDEMIDEYISTMRSYSIENVMALRGDIPENTENLCSGYTHAAQLIHKLKSRSSDFCIGAACYPEVHPESANQKEDIKYLKEKVDAGCDFLTTQMFFDNNLLYNFLYKIREAGITVPVIAGIMPITNAKYLERALKLSGSFMPQRFKSIVDRFGNDTAAMTQAGIAYATDQIIDLFANSITNVHIYSMNKPEVAAQIKSNLSDILGK